MPTDVNSRIDLLEQRLKEIGDRMQHVELLAVQMRERSAKDAVLDLPDTFTVQTRSGEKTFSVYHPSHYKIELLAKVLRDAVSKLKLPEGDANSFRYWTEQGLQALRKQGLWKAYYQAVRIILDPIADPDPAALSVSEEEAKLVPVTLVWQAFLKKLTPFFPLLSDLLGLIREEAAAAGQASPSPSLEQDSTNGA